MPRNLTSSAFMKPFVVLALPGMYLFYKYSQYKRQQQEQNRRKVTERELAHLNHKIDKLLSKLEENEPELATSQEDEECVICVNAKATMQTSPCGHRVVCRKCFVKTIQMAVSQRLLPLRCVICRAKILRLKQTGLLTTSQSWSVAPGTKPWILQSASSYSMSGVQVPNSESLYSMASGSSSISGVSSASSSSSGSSCSGKSGINRNYLRQPTGSFRKSQASSMKYHLQEYKEPVRNTSNIKEIEKPRLPPIQEFQREFRLGKERSTSTRIRCAQKIVTQLESGPISNNKSTSSKSSYFRPPLKPTNSELEKKPHENSKGGTQSKQKHSKETDKKRAESEKVDNKLGGNDENVEGKDERLKKNEKQLDKSKDKQKEDKKELSKAEKKEQKKEAKAEKKLAKKEAKLNEKKDKKE